MPTDIKVFNVKGQNRCSMEVGWKDLPFSKERNIAQLACCLCEVVDGVAVYGRTDFKCFGMSRSSPWPHAIQPIIPMPPCNADVGIPVPPCHFLLSPNLEQRVVVMTIAPVHLFTDHMVAAE